MQSTFWCTQLSTFPSSQRQLWKLSCHLQRPTYIRWKRFLYGLIQIATKARSRVETGDDMPVAISNEERRYSMIIKKTTTKEPLSSLCLVVRVLYKFIVSYSLQFIINYYLISDKGYETILWSIRGTSAQKGLRTTVLGGNIFVFIICLKQSVTSQTGIWGVQKILWETATIPKCSPWLRACEYPGKVKKLFSLLTWNI